MSILRPLVQRMTKRTYRLHSNSTNGTQHELKRVGAGIGTKRTTYCDLTLFLTNRSLVSGCRLFDFTPILNECGRGIATAVDSLTAVDS